MLSAITNFALAYNSKADIQSLKLALKSSNKYPSLLSVLQSLRFIGLNVDAGKCDCDNLKRINDTFLLHVHLNGNEDLVLARNKKDENRVQIFNVRYNSWRTIDEAELSSLWDGIVIYSNESPKTSNGKFPVTLLTIGTVVSITSLLIIVMNWYITITPLYIAIVLSIVLYARSFNNRTNIADYICHIGRYTNCNIQAPSINICGIRVYPIQLAVSYFLAQLCTILTANYELVYLHLYAITSIIIIPIVYISLSYQIKARIVCPICVGILFCLLGETIIGHSYITQLFDTNVLLVFSTLCVIMLSAIVLLSHLYYQSLSIEKLQITSLYFKRQKHIIEMEAVHLVGIPEIIILGDNQASDIVTTFISPSCPHCRELAKDIFSMLKRNRVRFKWNIVLGKISTEDEGRILAWIQHYYNDKQNFIEMLGRWSNNLSDEFSTTIGQKGYGKDSVNKQFMEILEINSINHFPRIALNGRLLSNKYTIQDVEYIIYDNYNIVRT